MEAFQQILPRTTKKPRRSPKYLGFENDDSSEELTKSFPPNLSQLRGKRRGGDIEYVQPSFVQIIANTAAQVEPIRKLYPSPVLGEVSPTDPQIRPANQRPTDESNIDKEDK